MGSGQWSEERAQDWFQRQPWRKGINFLPSTASNQLEMFQADTFDAELLTRELGWARDLGFNIARIFLHDLLWQRDGDAFLDRVDSYLSIAGEAGIGSMLVLFDGCWDPIPKLGVQPDPRPRVHNSRWVQSPGKAALANLSAHEDRLHSYVQAVVGRFANDTRVVLWDIFNEADNGNVDAYGLHGERVPSAADAKGTELSPMEKAVGARALLQKAFLWAREVNPSQPLTAPIYTADTGDVDADAYRHATGSWILNASDVVSFHNYDPLEGMVAEVTQQLRLFHRPIVCSEYMARGVGSTFDPILGFLQTQNVWAINWGFVSGRSQSIYPWDSWNILYTDEPKLWWHDVLHRNGTPYLDTEAAYIVRVKGDSLHLV